MKPSISRTEAGRWLAQCPHCPRFRSLRSNRPQAAVAAAAHALSCAGARKAAS